VSTSAGQKAKPKHSTLDIGPRLKAARRAAGMSLRSLAGQTGFSASFLSQVELGQCSPSLASLEKIAAALDLSLVELLSDPPKNPSPVVRRTERESLRSAWSRATAESLLPAQADERLHAMLVSIDAGGKTGRLDRRRGSVEFAYCVRGRVSVAIGGVDHLLGPGDSVLLEGGQGVSWENLGRVRAEVLLVGAKLR
jgi:transcriptional regulator with XRE-family HTH domain